MTSLTREEAAALKPNPDDPIANAVLACMERDDARGLKKLLDEGVIDSNYTIMGMPLLTLSAACSPEGSSHQRVVEFLLKREDTQVERVALISGGTSAHYAAQYGQAVILSKLLQNGKGAIHPNSSNNKGFTALYIACCLPNREKILDVLLKDSRTSVDPHPLYDPLVAAIASGHFEYVKMLAEHPGIDITAPRRMQVFRPHDRKRPISIFSLDEKAPTKGGDLFVVQGSLLDFAEVIEGNSRLKEYLSNQVEKARLKQRKSPSAYSSSSRSESPVSDHSASSTSSVHSDLTEYLLSSYASSEEDSFRDGSSVSSEDSPRSSVDSDDSVTQIMRNLIKTQPVPGVQKQKSASHILEEKHLSFVAAHEVMLAVLQSWHVNSLKKDKTRPPVFMKELDPAVRAFNAAFNDQEKFQAMVRVLLQIDEATLPNTKSKTDFRQLCDVVLNAAAKEHELILTETEMASLRDKVSAAPDSPRPLTSFAPFFRAALAQNKAESKFSTPISPPRIG